MIYRRRDAENKEFRDYSQFNYIDDERLYSENHLKMGIMYKKRDEFYNQMITLFKTNTRTKMFGKYEIIILFYEKYFEYLPIDDPKRTPLYYHQMFEVADTGFLHNIINGIIPPY